MKQGKKILLGVLTGFLLVVAVGGFLIYNLFYPKVMVSGSGEKKVLCVGDSLTYGQGVFTSRDTDSYPALLADLLGEEYQVWNYGLTARTLQSTGNLPYCDEKQYEESLSQNADIVILMLGTNDSKPDFWNAEQFEEEYRQFIQQYQAMESSPEVYIMLPPAIFLKNPNSGNCSDSIVREELIPIITLLSQQTGAGLIDLYSITEDHPEWYGDGLHLDLAGNEAIAQEIYDAISAQQ